MYQLRITHMIELEDDIASSPAELIEMYQNKEFVIKNEDIVEISAVQKSDKGEKNQ